MVENHRPTLARMSDEPARYEPQAIEARWQKLWDAERTWEVPSPGEPGFDAEKPKSFGNCRSTLSS